MVINGYQFWQSYILLDAILNQQFFRNLNLQGIRALSLNLMGNRECVRNLDLRVQVHPEELWVSKSVGAHSTRSLKISGCKRWCPKDLRVRAPAAPVLMHSLPLQMFSKVLMHLEKTWPCWGLEDSRPTLLLFVAGENWTLLETRKQCSIPKMLFLIWISLP